MHAGDHELASLTEQAARLREAGRVPEAIAAYERLLALAPALPNSWYNLALLQRRARRPEAALAAYARALALGIDEPEEVHLNRGVIFADDLHRPDDAERELRAALALNPRYAPALLNLGNLHEDRGERDAARAQYRRLLDLAPASADALARMAGVSTIADAADPLARRLRDALAASRVAADRATLGFALGRLLDGCGAYDDAFAVFTQAKRDSRSSAPPGTAYDRAAHEALVDALIAAFPARAAPAVASGALGSPGPPGIPTPIFVCGMFRSGSTLCEQVLARHPRVAAGGELDALPALAAGALAPFPQAVPRLDAAAVQRLASGYLAQLAALFPGAAFVTDKRPDNYLLIGLIKTLMPGARIVHTVRDALDTCISIHGLHLAHSQPWALDLLDTGHHLVQYRRLMRHWKALYGDDILDFDYDRFVRDPQPATAALLGHCGLDWDAACLQFHHGRGAVRTASVWQVREPLYQRSSGRWRHYARHHEPLRRLLGDS